MNASAFDKAENYRFWALTIACLCYGAQGWAGQIASTLGLVAFSFGLGCAFWLAANREGVK